MQQVFNKYINYLEAERNASPYTVRNYTTDLLGSKNIKGFFSFLSERGIKSLNEVNRALLRDYLAYLMEQGLVKASIARKLSAIRSFYRYLVREEILPLNPIKETTSPKLEKRLPSFLTTDEITALLAVPDSANPVGQRDRALMELLYSGLMVSELVKLNLEQVNLDSREIRVWGEGSKERMVLMGEPATNALTAYLNGGRRQLMGKKKNTAVFLNRYGGHLTERNVQSIQERYAEGQRDRAWLEVLYAAGIRVSELVSLNLEQVNLDTREIRAWGKGAKERMVLIGEPAARALATYLNQGRPTLLGTKKGTALFLNRYGERLTERSVQRILEKYANIVGIKKMVHPHMLRR